MRSDAALDSAPPDSISDGATCPPFYRPIGSGTYAVLSPASFKNHMAACASHGTHLAVIDSVQELTDLVVYGRTVNGVSFDSRFYVGLVQAPDQAEPDDNWIDFFDRNADSNLWSSLGNELFLMVVLVVVRAIVGLGALRLDHSALVDLAITENVRAYCECDRMAIGAKAQMYLDALP